MTIRILQGSLKGKKLADHDAWVRPTSAYRREMIFNRLTHAENLCDFSALRVLDVFAGSGALGLEALSRGACHVTFIEPNAITVKKLSAFIENNHLNNRTNVIQAAVPNIPPCPEAPFDLCFLDAPYGHNLIPQALNNLKISKWIQPDTLYVAETDLREELLLPSWIFVTHKRTKGRTHVYFLRHKNTKQG